MYTINMNYQTGDSHHSETDNQYIGCSFRSLEKAKQALQDIKEHYQLYQYMTGQLRDTIGIPKTPEKRLEHLQEYANKEWMDHEEESLQKAFERDTWSYMLKVETDDGERQRISAFWVGYFEKLYQAEIVILGDSDETMKVVF